MAKRNTRDYGKGHPRFAAVDPRIDYNTPKPEPMGTKVFKTKDVPENYRKWEPGVTDDPKGDYQRMKPDEPAASWDPDDIG